MKLFSLAILLVIFLCGAASAQNTLFDDSQVSSVYIEINPDSLSYIMANVLSEHYFMAKFIYKSGTSSDTLQNVGFRLRGNTSRFSQKKSFKISFNEYVSGRKYQGVKKINLNGEHNDPTMIREKLFYDTWVKAGFAERRTSFVRLYINYTYYGLYTNLEEYDKEWLQRVYGENTGNLYKCTYPADLEYIDNKQQSYKNILSASVTGGRAYDLQTNETTDDYTDLLELISLLDKPADASFAYVIAEKINVDEFLKAFALDIASGNWDDYMYNKNNYFLYHNTVTGKFEFVSYDTDNTFGVDWEGQDWTTRDCLHWYADNQPRPLARKLLSVPGFFEKYKFFLDTIANSIINPNIIFPHIDSLETLITSAATDDHYRTLDYGYTMADFHNGFRQTIDGHTPYGIKPFLSKRFTTIEQQLAASSVPETAGVASTMYLYPNPADNFIALQILPADDDREVFVLDVTGRRQLTVNLVKNTGISLLPIQHLSPGVYTLAVFSKGALVSRRFVKR